MELTVDELASRAGVTVRTVRFYAGRHLDDETIKRLEALGVVERISAGPPGRVRVASPALLGVSAELAALPLPLDTLIASYQAVDRHTTALAAELQQVFQDTVVRPYRAGGRAPQERERLMEMAGKLKPLMIQSLVTSFQRAVDKALRRSVPD